MRIKDEYIDVLQPAKCLNRRRAGVARSRADNGDPLARPRQRRLKQLTDQLHGDVFERQRRAVEQFQQEMVRAKLHQGRAGGMAKARIGLGDDGAEFGVGERVANEGPHYAERHILIAQPRKRRDFGMAQHRNRRRHIKPTIACEAGQHRLFETQYRRAAPGRNVPHFPVPILSAAYHATEASLSFPASRLRAKTK
ncbi:hypothetical protein GALL_508510 [mine drainage metagenome]|uniref:Uncharacterized protein n=1 Tax=mine drainage metagenome TaxID=410659 RepID=A0A1J5P7K5_9ZZZZ